MDGDGDNEEENEGDALSAAGPDEVFASNPTTGANRWPDGGEAAHPVRRPPAPDLLFPPGSPPDSGSADPGGYRSPIKDKQC